MCTRFHAAPAKEKQNDCDRKGEAATMSLDALMSVQLHPLPLTEPMRFAGMAWHKVVLGGTARHGIMLERPTGPSNESEWMRGPG